jgi:hypothetical protein
MQVFSDDAPIAPRRTARGRRALGDVTNNRTSDAQPSPLKAAHTLASVLPRSPMTERVTPAKAARSFSRLRKYKVACRCGESRSVVSHRGYGGCQRATCRLGATSTLEPPHSS